MTLAWTSCPRNTWVAGILRGHDALVVSLYQYNLRAIKRRIMRVTSAATDDIIADIDNV